VLPLRLVIDTNVVVSGALKPKGLERTALVFAVTPPAILFVSNEILDEYGEVLSRPELRIPPLEVRSLLELVKSRGRLVAPKRKLAVCRDPDDNIFLECAEAARADYLITGNNKHFPTFWQMVKIINARDLLEIIGPHLGI
jgi:uncharacterized protein